MRIYTDFYVRKVGFIFLGSGTIFPDPHPTSPKISGDQILIRPDPDPQNSFGGLNYSI
jgi:hypothetical protein